MERKPIERNVFKRAWIWFWYSTVTRFVFALLGGHLVFLIPLLLKLGITGQALSSAATIAYALVFMWAMIDNDFSNLERIGLDVDRRRLPAGGH